MDELFAGLDDWNPQPTASPFHQFSGNLKQADLDDLYNIMDDLDEPSTTQPQQHIQGGLHLNPPVSPLKQPSRDLDVPQSTTDNKSALNESKTPVSSGTHKGVQQAQQQQQKGPRFRIIAGEEATTKKSKDKNPIASKPSDSLSASRPPSRTVPPTRYPPYSSHSNQFAPHPSTTVPQAQPYQAPTQYSTTYISNGRITGSTPVARPFPANNQAGNQRPAPRAIPGSANIRTHYQATPYQRTSADQGRGQIKMIRGGQPGDGMRSLPRSIAQPTSSSQQHYQTPQTHASRTATAASSSQQHYQTPQAHALRTVTAASSSQQYRQTSSSSQHQPTNHPGERVSTSTFGHHPSHPYPSTSSLRQQSATVPPAQSSGYVPLNLDIPTSPNVKKLLLAHGGNNGNVGALSASAASLTPSPSPPSAPLLRQQQPPSAGRGSLTPAPAAAAHFSSQEPTQRLYQFAGQNKSNRTERTSPLFPVATVPISQQQYQQPVVSTSTSPTGPEADRLQNSIQSVISKAQQPTTTVSPPGMIARPYQPNTSFSRQKPKQPSAPCANFKIDINDPFPSFLTSKGKRVFLLFPEGMTAQSYVAAGKSLPSYTEVTDNTFSSHVPNKTRNLA